MSLSTCIGSSRSFVGFRALEICRVEDIVTSESHDLVSLEATPLTCRELSTAWPEPFMSDPFPPDGQISSPVPTNYHRLDSLIWLCDESVSAPRWYMFIAWCLLRWLTSVGLLVRLGRSVYLGLDVDVDDTGVSGSLEA